MMVSYNCWKKKLNSTGIHVKLKKRVPNDIIKIIKDKEKIMVIVNFRQNSSGIL